MVICDNCGIENEEDAKFCVGCGKTLPRNIHKMNVSSQNKTEKSGLSRGIKILIVVIVVLVGTLGLTAGMLFQKPSTSIIMPAANSTSTPVQQPSTQSQVYQPTWHQVATYTGPGIVRSVFSIQGNQFKVTMSAVPKITYNTNYLDVGIGKGNYLVGRGTLSWSSNENPNKKEGVIPVSQGAGTYDIDIVPTDLQSYTVTVWDYY